MKWIVIVALLVACSSKKTIGMNNPDGGGTVTDDGNTILPPDGHVGHDGGTGDGSTCSCDASSCGPRICGRSDCGYPCGTCGPDEACFFAGISCQPAANMTPCIDAFGDKTWPLDSGFRTCPTDATKQQSCLCGGNGPDDWNSCATTCIKIETCTQPPPPVDITCGTSTCSGGDVCCTPSSDLTGRSCSHGTCPSGSYERSCDGAEDCPTGQTCCSGGPLSPTASCTATGSCDSEDVACHTASDCPTGAPYCCPGVLFPDIRSCSTGSSAGCN